MGKYHDLHVQSDTLLLADYLKAYQNTFYETYELHPAHFFCTKISMTKSPKKFNAKLNLLNNIDMPLMVKKVLEVKHIPLFINIQKSNNRYMKDYDKSKEFCYLKHWGVKNLYGLKMLQKKNV